MSFNSITFCFKFLPLILFIYFFIPNKVKNAYLLTFSLIFYAFGSAKDLGIMILLLIYNFFAVNKMNKLKNRYRKLKFLEIIFVNVFLLCYFKYYFLFLDFITYDKDISYKTFLLPLGFSFYIFSMLSYVFDVFRKKIPNETNFISFGLYITFFSKLLMGPIVRYEDFKTNLENHPFSSELFHNGFKRFIIGLAMKVMLANTFLTITSSYEVNSMLGAWLIILAYAFQIYFDFAGYSNMAIGLSNLFGFKIEENFNYPYISKSVSEFWNRWHITLGKWFKDYIYIPLGGNRTSKLKMIRNLMIVWILTGMWHGASFNFIIWGLYFGIIVVLEKTVFKNLLENIPSFLKIILTFILVSIGWIFFFNNDIEKIMIHLKYAFDFNNKIDNEALFLIKNYYLIFIIGFIGTMPTFDKLGTILYEKHFLLYNILTNISIILLTFLSISYMISGSYTSFLYFNF